jgi:hypothetical protein
MTAAPDMKPSEALRKARELITPLRRWIKGSYARDACGYTAYINESDAVCFCAMGALYRSYCVDVDTEIDAEKLLASVIGGSVINFNDGHTHAEVLDAFDRAIALAESEGR